ncbi:IS66 family insertion sequence element accessory protein TnpB [Pseudoalteromonas sp. DL2-H2.2]|uniref:IS66 family insertion sequence element accessory protein TnpB n=1 Tax=Pseudoalteromonas sp. DL2-H2.2 TaxID=2908889 RepID=UPI001F2A1D88|nr:IS66 family insertion sequence element accessory protein TnpB [Pseudoalteromonas sp. DL2-H2.2]MCF2909651.1 IS66 family insertion sequence element accessory protein TnpB [Pseudoalteromonas sp. DL2-H2.2]
MAAHAMSGQVFAFCNKNKDKLKVLYWDKTGFALWYKRLEKDKSKLFHYKPLRQRVALELITALVN